MNTRKKNGISQKEELQKVERELKRIENDLERRPNHFSLRDILSAFFGALIVGITFIFKGSFIKIASSIPWPNILFIIFVNLCILAAGIYFIGYQKVYDKKSRPLTQFIIKRLVAFYATSFAVAVLLAITFDLMAFVSGPEEMMKVIFVLTFPCSTGAALGDLVKKYV